MPRTLILASSQGLLLGYIRGEIKSIYPKLVLYGSKNKCTRTGSVFDPISQVCTNGLNLYFSLKIYFQISNQVTVFGLFSP